MKKIICLILSTVTLLSFASCGKKPEDMENQKSSTVNVSVYKAGTDSIKETVTYTGEIKATSSVSISSKVSAKAVSVEHKEGDFVNAGDVLAKLDATDVKLAYQQAEAGYNTAVANYNMVINSSTKQASTNAQQGLNSAQIAYNTALDNYNREKQLYENNSTVTLAEQSYNDAVNAYNRQKELYDNDASVIAASNTLNTAKQNSDRTQQLFDIGAASQVELETAQNAVTNAQANYDMAKKSADTQLDSAHSAMVSAEENLKNAKISASTAFNNASNSLKTAENALKTARENVGLTKVSTQESIKTAAASVESAKASLNTAKNTLDNTTITAPISGYVASKNINVGQMVAQGVEIFSIKNANSVDAEISVTEAVISKVVIGTPAEIKVASLEDTLSGTVSLVNTVKDANTGMYTVRVSIPNEDDVLKVGMFADVTLTTNASENNIVIPSEALLQKDEEMYVYVVGHDGKAEKRTVLVGIQNSDSAEILSGVTYEDEVIVSGKEYLSDTNNEIKITSREDE